MLSRSRLAATRRLAVVGLVLVAALALAAVASAAPVTSVTVQSGPGTAGTADPNVQVSSDNGATWSQAFNVAPNSRYSTIPGTGWDSVSSNGSAGSGDFLYQASINVPANAVNPSLSGSYYSDNRGSASVNGTQVAQNNACDGGSGEFADYGFNGAPATTFSSGLNTGSNTISFAVNNCASGPTGVDFTATASFTLAPTSKDDCKNDGWENLTDRNGTSFKNQGDCVSYVATGGRNLAAG